MTSKSRFAFNVMMNWAAMAVGMTIPFFLTPFVVRSLGATAYGIWILAVSTVSYLGILDLGLRSAIIRFVSKAEAQGNLQEAQSSISAALWFRILISSCVVVLSVALAFLFPHLFKIPAGMERAAQITVLLCALGVAITLVSGVFGAVLAAINRFDVLSSVSMGQALARACGVILILRSGRGLISLACWEFTVILLSGLVTSGVALKIFPTARVRVARPDAKTLKSIWAYSFTTFISIVAVQVIINTDNLVVGAMLSVAAVSFYSIGSSLMTYSGQVVSALSTTFTPLASRLDASGRSEELQKLLLRGTQATLGLALPISLTLLLRGKTFISLWMGPQYSEISGTVLQILLISQFLGVANTTASSIMMAIDKHKTVAKWSSIEAALNLGLSLVLVKVIGIYGVAWGTSAVMVVIHLMFWPRYVHTTLGVSIRRYVWEGWGLVTLCSIPFGVACAAADRYWHPHSLFEFFSQVAITLPVYAICMLIFFRTEVTSLFARWRSSRTPVDQPAS
jgi:O-antigen/teichoic acid export membrane protein